MSRIKQLAKDSIVYGVGGVLAKGIGFFLLPIYTRLFTPEDYGTIEMLMVVTSFLSVLLAMGMDSAQSYYFFQQKEKGKIEQARIISAILQWKLICGSGIVIIATLLSPLLNKWLFNGILAWEYFAISFCGALFAKIMAQSAEVFRLLYRPGKYILITLTQSICAAVIILILVLFFKLGILGYIIGSSIASLIVGLFGWVLVREYVDFNKMHVDWWPRLLRFSIPLLPAGLAMYVMNTADRWFVQYYHGVETLGIYAIGAKFALLLGLVIETFRKAWWPIAMDSMHSHDGPSTFRMIARLYMGIGASGVVYLAFLSPWLVKWLTPVAYFNAYLIVGILAWQSLFYGFYLIVSAGIWKSEKTFYAMFLMGGAAILNIILNYMLVPSFGGVGAALGTSVAYFLWVAVSLYVSEKLWTVNFSIRTMLIQILFGTGAVSWLLIAYNENYSILLIAFVAHVSVMLLILTSATDGQLSVFIKKFKKI